MQVTSDTGTSSKIRSGSYEALPTSVSSSACLLDSISCARNPLSFSSSVSAFLVLVSIGEETEEVFRRLLLAGSYRCIDLRRFRSLPPLLALLLRRRRGGVMLRLLLRVSRRSSRSWLLRASDCLSAISATYSEGDAVTAFSPLRDVILRGLRLDDLEVDLDLDLELESCL